ncbi:hypothetical protein IM316_18635 [Enterobacter cloacae complex sp. S4]|uniref:Bro-N domain-containing protein n=1 Tax=Enterobacter roggenkampii TaxID=1812935 RepID=A0AAX1WIG0_9ENTR|nr:MULTISPECIES: BRO family protein [Enterobacter cloacae complex]CAE6220464.1 hypothetical protein AI2705V1_0629 [Enterobacter cloacae]EHF8256085.1 hypothetical protein [Enterobacter roggenkampii]ELD8600749.1 hypothetical protein [Enterobacter roggenkampii]KTJ32178.1 hypothetical protein ASU87_17110 [Enterobacter roggenkampii]MBE4869368.1 hypothetical protein [Enterobacter cloacae complex sp. S4]
MVKPRLFEQSGLRFCQIPSKEFRHAQCIKEGTDFPRTPLAAINRNGQFWFTSSDIAKALGYSSADSVSRIYRRNIDEFSAVMSQTVKLTASGNYQKTARIFTLHGAYLLAMLARTLVAKGFRRWVLDILDRECHPRRLLIPEKLTAIFPCCGRSATIIDSRYITRHRTEITARCDQPDCPDQQFKSEVTFSHYIEEMGNDQTLRGMIHSLSMHHKQTLIRMLSETA